MTVIRTADLAGHVPVAAATYPMGGAAWRGVMQEGASLAEIVAAVPALPAWFEDYGVVCVGGDPVPRCYWSRRPHERTLTLTPKSRPHDPVWVTLHAAPQGGGRGTKSVISIVAAVALLAVGTFISGGGLAGLGGLAPGLFAGGSTSAALLATGVTTLGRLALTLLSPPAGRDDEDRSAPVIGSAGASGNTLQPGGPIPRIAGRLKVFPPFACFPLVELNGDDETVEAAYVLAGPHRIRDLRIEGASIDDIEDLQYVVDEGLEGQPLSILGRYGLQRSPNFELLAHRRDLDVPENLRHQSSPETDTPRWRVEVTAEDPDEIWLQLTWPSGMTNSQTYAGVAMPFRLRMRELGTRAWTNLPELMFSHNKTGSISKKIVIKWGDPPNPIADTNELHGAWQSFHTVPEQNNIPPSGLGGWSSHSSFVRVPADCNKTSRVVRAYDGFTIYLDDGVFPRGKRWEVGIIRGAIFDKSDITPETYNWQAGIGDVLSFFDYRIAGSDKIVPSSPGLYDDGVLDRVVLSRFASVRNQAPLPKAGHARIEIRGRALQVSQLSCVASAYVPDWDGSEWTGLTASNNPAVHLRDVMAGLYTDDPVTAASLNNDELVAFRTRCIDQDYQVAMSIDGQNWWEVMQSIASCGFGRVRAGARWGVAFDRDSSAETPTQIFSGRNASDITYEKPFTPLDDAFRVSYRNRANDWNPEELLVIRPGLERADVRRIIPVQAVGLDRADSVMARFEYDLLSGRQRDSVISFECAAEGLMCQMGDLIGITHTILSRHHASARIAEIETDGAGDVVSLVLDNSHAENRPASITLAADLGGLADLAAQGVKLAATIVRNNLTQVTATIEMDGREHRRIIFTTPQPPARINRQNLVVIGEAEMVSERFLVRDVTPARHFNMRVTAVPEAPGLWS